MNTILKKENKRLIRPETGFSLIEILIAIAVLSFGLLSISAMQTTAIRGNAKSNDLTQRIATSSNQVETLLTLPFTDARLAAGNHDPENDGIDNDGDGVIDEADDDGELNYTATWTVTDDSASKKTIVLTLTGFKNNSATTITMNTIKIR